MHCYDLFESPHGQMLLVAERPCLKVLFTRGYSPDVVNRLLHFAPGQLLQRPYTAAVLVSDHRRRLEDDARDWRLRRTVRRPRYRPRSTQTAA